MTATDKLAQKRLTLLQLAENLGNVSKACRHHNVSRSQFYEYKRAFQEFGLSGLVDRPPIPASHPNEVPDETKMRIIELSLAEPSAGQQRIADQLALEGVSVCASTVRNIWIKEGLETKYKRLLRLEEKTATGFVLTEKQTRLIEKANPEFAERHVESDYPGQLLCQDTFYVGRMKGVGRVYLQAVVETYGSYAFGKIYTSKRPETAVDALYDRVLPFYEEHGLPIQAILTDNGTEFKGRPMIHLYEIFTELNDIEHRTTKVATPRTNGFVERFNRTVLDEFFRMAFRTRFLRIRGCPTGGPGRLASQIQQRAAPPGLPEHGATAHRDLFDRQKAVGGTLPGRRLRTTRPRGQLSGRCLTFTRKPEQHCRDKP